MTVIRKFYTSLMVALLLTINFDIYAQSEIGSVKTQKIDLLQEFHTFIIPSAEGPIFDSKADSLAYMRL